MMGCIVCRPVRMQPFLKGTYTAAEMETDGEYMPMRETGEQTEDGFMPELLG